ncbi:helix-turn-helix domain-containing protein, partial [Paenibacillus pini]|uniref:helix-turn-helix domain-containing protein n=1 Tax=Paenibacillus pini TaxID=669461 RepID=UPI000564CB70
MNSDFGKKFKRLRETSGFESQRSLSVSSGVSNATIARIENGERIPFPTTLKKLSKCLKVTYEELMTAAGYL